MNPVTPLIPVSALAALLLIAGAPVVSAQDGANGIAAGASAVFRRFDLDGDGKVTKRELPSEPAFARYDADRDGAITLEEYAAVAGGAPNSDSPAGPAQAGAALDAIVRSLDANRDGAISREEAAGASWFDRADLNRDGVIGSGEIDLLRKVAGRRGAGGDGMPSAPPVTPEEMARLTSGPEMLKPGDAGIGRMIADAAFTDLAGKAHRLGAFGDRKGLVIAMTSATCPVSKRYLPSLATLEKELAARDIALLLVNPFASESREEIAAQLAGHAFQAPYVHDGEKVLAGALQARTTTEVFLLDAARTLVYRGALDDQYGVNYSLDAPRARYLEEAVDALLAGERPRIEATAAPGCELDLGEAPGLAVAPVTWHRDVARILEQNCVACHRDGGIAPFALDDVEEVTDRARAIRRVVTEGAMPPWFAAPAPDGAPNPWANDCSLSARDKADLLAWIESADRPMGDPADAPARRVFRDEWSIGTPDLVLPLSRAFDIKATGFMPYQFDVVETDLAEDKWVRAFEILPSARDVVHHVIVNVHEKGSGVRDQDDGVGGYWAAYVPGNGSHVYPEGFARKLPAGARVSFQIHYTPSGRAVKERLRMGLVFAEAPPRYEVRTLALADRDLNIPPGAAAHEESLSRRVPWDIPVTSFLAHMHVRGKSFKFEFAHADGAKETLLDIPRYDFNWQLRYDLKEPRILPAGGTVTVTAVYDNSAANKANPDPAKRVKWGSQTYEEMMIGYLEYFVPVGAAEVAGR